MRVPSTIVEIIYIYQRWVSRVVISSIYNSRNYIYLSKVGVAGCNIKHLQQQKLYISIKDHHQYPLTYDLQQQKLYISIKVSIMRSITHNLQQQKLYISIKVVNFGLISLPIYNSRNYIYLSKPKTLIIA